MPSKQVELPPSPGVGKGPGWYQIGTNPNDQAHWDGEAWTARRHWGGARWVELPVEVAPEPAPGRQRGGSSRTPARRAPARRAPARRAPAQGAPAPAAPAPKHAAGGNGKPSSLLYEETTGRVAVLPRAPKARPVPKPRPVPEAVPEEGDEGWRAVVLPRVAMVATAGAIAVWALGIHGIHASRIGGTGFIDAVDPAFFVASSLLVLAFAATLASLRPPRWLLVVQVAGLVAMLYATIVIVEPLPRFNTAWLHAGFSDYIARHGQALPSYDARFSWPGFFSLTALLSRAAGLKSAVELLRWAPVYFNALYAIGVYAIARTATKNERARWLAVWLFLSFNWVGQDYFSPQAFADVLAICFVVVLLRWFRTPVPSPIGARFPGIAALLGRAPDELTSQDADRKQKLELLALLLLLFGAAVVSHQLTPPVMVIWVVVVVVTMRAREPLLPLALGAVFLLWLSFATVTYWSGHLHDIFGSLLQPGQILHQNLTNRVSGSASRLTVQDITLAFTAFIYFVGGLGVLRRLRVGRGDLTFALLAVAPLAIVFVQSYGGEALLRSVFLGLPFLAVLAALAFLPRATVPGVGKALCLGALLAGLVPLFLVARYGNESWQYETPAEFAAFQYVYDHAPRGSVLVSIADEVPWGYRDIGKIVLSGNHALTSPVVANRELSIRAPAAYLVVTRSQVAYGRNFVGLPANWARKLETALLDSGRYRVAFSNADAQVLTRVHAGGSR